MAPFATPPTLDDLRAGALVLDGLGRQQMSVAFDAMRAIVAGGVRHKIEWTAIHPGGLYSITPDHVFVAISGTFGELQWILHVLGSQQVSAPPFPGRIGQYFGLAASQISNEIKAAILPALPSRRLVLLGHSFGGAIAQLLLSVWGPQAGGGGLAVVYGSPRVGDADFAASLGSNVVRIEDTQDPIVCLPPATWLGEGSPWFFPGGLQLADYVHAGEARTLTQEGELQDGEQHLSLTQVWGQLQDFKAPTHLIEEYKRRLDHAAAWQQIGGDFADLPALNDIDRFLSPPAGGLFLGGPMALVQGTMFFRTEEESQGWSESWYADLAVPNMLDTIQALAVKRANFLAGTCEIHAYRAAVVEIGQPKQSRTKRLLSPIKATTSIKNAVPSGRTNDTMDAIDYLITSTNSASKKTAAFRGIPDEWISGSKLSESGVDGVKRIETFLDAVKAANLGLRVYQRGGGFPVKGVKSMSNDAGSGLIKVEVTAHGYADGSYITLRRTRANPMLQGRWKIGLVDVNNFLLQGSFRFACTSSNDGTVQQYATTNDQISDYGFSGVSTRKTGKPFGQRRGKRSAKLLHH